MNSQNKNSSNHWYGSTIPANSYLQNGEYRPTLVLWTRDISVLSSDLVHPDEAPDALKRTFREALAKESNAPDHLSVDSAESLAQLRPFAPEVEFDVAKDGFVAVMAQDIMRNSPELEPPDTFYEKGIDAGSLRAFLASMKKLFDTGVLVEDNCHFVSVNIPSLGIDNQLLWLGNDCVSFGRGFALFPTIDCFRAWMRVNVCFSDVWEESDNQSFFQAGFTSLECLSETMQSEVYKTPLAIKHDRTANLNAMDENGVRKPAEKSH